MLVLLLRLFLGDISHPIPYGEVWLVANQWGASPAVLVGSIQSGAFKERTAVRVPADAFEYRLLIGGSDTPILPPEHNETERGYDIVDRFHYFYLSPPFEKDWPAELKRIGAIVPRPSPRVIRFVNMDGKPLANANILVSVFGSNRNHCGWSGGITVGTFRTDTEGRILFTTQSSPLAINHRYSEEQTGGPAGKAFAARADLITGPERDITLRKWWTLPLYDYVVTVRPGRPGIRADACLFDLPCGAGCGPVTRNRPPQVSDNAGVLRFAAADLREMERITLVDSKEKERALSQSEMWELLTSHRLTLDWRAQ